MIEKFNVVRVRFHIEEEQILVLQGWKHGMKPEDTLEVTLDGVPLSFTMETYDGMEVRQRYMIYDLGIEEEYYLYVTLPEDFGTRRELTLRVRTESRPEQEGRFVYREKVSNLQKLQGQVDFFLEQVTLKKDQCYLKG